MAQLRSLDSSTQYTVGWIAALAHERAAALMMLDERHGKPRGFVKNRSDPNSYAWGCMSGHNVVIASLPDGEYGLVSAAGTAHGLQASLPHIRIGLMVGIGAGIPDGDKRLLGDVVVSKADRTNGGVIQYDLYKVKQEMTAKQTKRPVSVKERKGVLNSPPKSLRHALAALHAEHEVARSKISEHLSNAFERNEMTRGPYGFPGPGKDPLRRPSSRLAPTIHYGTIASGNVLMKDAAEREALLHWLRENNIDAICLEMEAAGLMNSFPCVVIRGICDYADENKDDDWQRYAAATAAAFAKELLEVLDKEDADELLPLYQPPTPTPTPTAAPAAAQSMSSRRTTQQLLIVQPSLLKEAAYRSLVAQLCIVVGPDPPEKFVPKIKRLRKWERWRWSKATVKRTLAHEHFDPSSAMHRGDYLFAASCLGDKENVQCALAAGADANYIRLTDVPINALSGALTFDHTSVIEILLKSGASLSHLCEAAELNEQSYLQNHLPFLSASTVQLFLDHSGKSVLPSTALAFAAYCSVPGVLDLLLEYGWRMDMMVGPTSPPMFAAMRNNPANLAFFLDHGYHINACDYLGNSLLTYAIIGRHVAMIEFLIGRNIDFAARNNEGCAAAHALVMIEQLRLSDAGRRARIGDRNTQKLISIMRQLCATGQMPLDELDNQGLSALHYAAFWGQFHMVEALLDCGADYNVVTSEGIRPLHVCAVLGDRRSEIAALLIRKGASLKAQGPQLSSPYGIAKGIAEYGVAKIFASSARGRGVLKWIARNCQ